MRPSTLLSLILAIALAVVCVKTYVKPSSDEAAAPSATGGDAIKNIMTRSSVRSYQNKPVEKEKITTLLKAGMAAPTAVDKRPWHFVVVTDKTKIAGLAKANPHATFMTKAPLVIVVCGDTDKTLDGDGEDFWIQDTSAATENILLAAHALGLGAVWTGAYPLFDRADAIAHALDLPENLIPLNAIVIGYPDGPANVKDKYDEKNVTYYN